MLRPRTSAGNQKAFLHFFLVLGVFLYLYSPYLDHWLGTEVHTRPHTHAAVSTDLRSEGRALDTASASDHAHDHEYEESVLCFLDIDALLSLLLILDVFGYAQMQPHSPLVFELEPDYLLASTIYLAVSSPPPII